MNSINDKPPRFWKTADGKVKIKTDEIVTGYKLLISEHKTDPTGVRWTEHNNGYRTQEEAELAARKLAIELSMSFYEKLADNIIEEGTQKSAAYRDGLIQKFKDLHREELNFTHTDSKSSTSPNKNDTPEANDYSEGYSAGHMEWFKKLSGDQDKEKKQ